MRLLANIISGMFHPLLMVTYGLILAFSFTYLVIYPPMMKLLLVGGTFLSTAVIPGIFLFFMVKSGAATDMELSNRRERVLPYLVFISSVVVCAFYMIKMMMPFWFVSLLLGVCLALIIALVINVFWKISAHAIGVGGLLGGVMGVAYTHVMNPYWFFIFMFIVVGVVGSSRIYLEKHTPMQVFAGYILGFGCTFVASILSYIYLFI